MWPSCLRQRSWAVNGVMVGQFSFSGQDLVIPVNGIPLTVTRTYSSLNPRSADFGYGWSCNLIAEGKVGATGTTE